MTAATADPNDIARLAGERDLYLRLLNLGLQDEPEPFLEQALELVTRVVGAHQGYLEIDARVGSSDAPRWWRAHGFSAAEIDAVREVISRGIIAEVLSAGETVITGSALGDERFEARHSVRGARIEAVLCTPIGRGDCSNCSSFACADGESSPTSSSSSVPPCAAVSLPSIRRSAVECAP